MKHAATKRKNMMIAGIAVFVIVIAILIIGLSATGNHRNNGGSVCNCDDDIPCSGSSSASSSPWDDFRATSYTAAIATDSVECSEIGADILRAGGNAVDAAVAATLCLGVVSPASSGLGGGCFIVMHNSTTGENLFVDAREVAPSGAHPHMFVDDPLAAQNGGPAVAVLGELRGLYHAWEHHGSGNVSWADLVLPSVPYAESWPISAQLNDEMYDSDEFLYGDFPALSAIFKDERGYPKAIGTIIKRPELAHTLKQIATNGADYLYDTMADTLAAEIAEAGGYVTADDIRNYKPLVYPALETTVMGHTYVGARGSSSGGPVVSGILKYMQSVAAPLASQGAQYYHWLVEAMKHGFAIRLSLADPEYFNVSRPVNALLSDAYMATLQRELSSDSSVQELSVYGGTYNMQNAGTKDAGTTHLSVIDPLGNAVSLTSTINTGFGSKLLSAATGIIFNNEMDDFSIPNKSNHYHLAPSPFNFPEAGKRPLSSMSPSILLDSRGKVRLVGGASGGPHIITGTAQVILNVLGRGMDLLRALTHYRVHSQLLPDEVDCEHHLYTLDPSDDAPPAVRRLQVRRSGRLARQGVVFNTDDGNSAAMGFGGALRQNIIAPERVYAALRACGHRNVTAHTGSVGVTQFISVDPDTGLIEAVSDPRKNGRPAAL